jgi:hypothetical protein
MNFAEEMKNFRLKLTEDCNQNIKEKIKNAIKNDPYSNSWEIDLPSNSNARIKEFLDKEGFLSADVCPYSLAKKTDNSIRISFK